MASVRMVAPLRCVALPCVSLHFHFHSDSPCARAPLTHSPVFPAVLLSTLAGPRDFRRKRRPDREFPPSQSIHPLVPYPLHNCPCHSDSPCIPSWSVLGFESIPQESRPAPTKEPTRCAKTDPFRNKGLECPTRRRRRRRRRSSHPWM